MQLVDCIEPAMDLIGTQICGQSNIGSRTLNVNETSLGSAIDRFQRNGRKCQRFLRLRFKLGPLSLSARWLSGIAGRPGPIIEAASIYRMQLAVSGFA